MSSRRQSTDVEESQVAQWFEGRTVFITGGSGFMGKVLVEKLLSACPGIARVYLLMRNKKDVAPTKRLDNLKQAPIFDCLRKSHPTRLDKLQAVSGDITLPELGLSAADQQRLREVSVVFHTAATVKFDEVLKLSVTMNILATVRLMQLCRTWPNLKHCVSVVFHTAATVKFDEVLKLSVTMNILATVRLMQLCRTWPSLESFVHVSTAYCNCDRTRVEERIYPAPANLNKLLAACDCLDDSMLDDITTKMIGNRPNTYTFTKAMGEQVILENAGMFPIAIFRPSIVTASLESPMPGWVDSLNGPTGLIVGTGKGIVRSIYCTGSYVADLIPVDIAINTMIAVAWQTGVDKIRGVKVYNCTSGLRNPITWDQLKRWTHSSVKTHPFNDIFWYPGGSFKGNRYFNELCVFLFQTVPAYAIDYSAKLMGKEPKLSMVRLQRKLTSAISVMEYFMTHEWTFFSDNVQSLQARLSEADRRLFECDVTKIRWRTYFEHYVKGARKYILREEDSQICEAKSRMRKMFLLHNAVKFLVVFFIIRAFLARSETARKITYGCINTAVSLFSQLYGTAPASRSAKHSNSLF